MMVNREDCGLDACRRWISRQLLTMRLYHPLWPLVLLHGFGTTLLLAVAVVATVRRRDSPRLAGGPVVRRRPGRLRGDHGRPAGADGDARPPDHPRARRPDRLALVRRRSSAWCPRLC